MKNYFTINELLVNCRPDERTFFLSNPAFIDNMLSLHTILNVIRDRFGSPIRVTSSARDKQHNENAGGVKNSQHLSWSAADIMPYNADVRGLVRTIKELIDEGEITCGQYIEYGTKHFVHISLPTLNHKNDYLYKL